ncbi:SpoIIE family protein phosphatase [Streptomyces sp. NPDC004629]|uniref:SpoIIE family protein phosphatase n=1 Tax=Streptomyces sp. NPDC004629 TaxID=3364705 RepID=UPI00367A42FD
MPICEDTAPITRCGAGRPAGPVPDTAVAVIDAKGTVAGWTQSAERLIGFTADDVIGRSATELLAASEDGAKASAGARRCRDEGGWSGRVGLRHRDGGRLDVHVRVAPLSGRGAETHWLVAATGRRTVTSATSATSSPVQGVALESLLASAPIGVAVRDRELRCIWVNDALETQDGIARERRLGRRLAEVLPGCEADAVEAVMREVLASGAPKVDHEYRLSLPADPRREHAFSTSFFRLDDAEGGTLGVCAMIVDVTDRQRARERLGILSEAGTRIGSTLDVMRTGQELADFTVPLLADYVTVDLAESVQLGEESQARLGAMGGRIPAFRRAGVASVHEGAPESLWPRGEPVFVPASSPFTRVLTSGKPHLEPVLDTSAGTWLDEDPGRGEKIHRFGMHSLMILPIHARGAVLGVAVFVRADDPTPFDADDLLFAEDLVARAALSLDNARRYVRERAAALALQRNLLPRRLFGGAAVDVTSRYLPADTEDGVGGDWFDVIALSGARVALVVGDVVGHGINAAATMGRLRTAVHTLAAMDLPPDELLARLDDTIVRLAEEDLDDPTRTDAVAGATCLYAVYDPVTRRCTMARAGHPPPAIVQPDGRVGFPDLPSGLPLGVGMATFEAVELDLPEGCVLAFYTDGLVETRDADIDAGMDRLGAALARPDRPLDELCSAVVGTLPVRAPSDDATLLLARTHALSPSRIASWELPADPAVVGHARTLATDRLREWGLEHLAPTTELIVSELVTNAVRYGAGPVTLRLIRHHVLVCEVFDANDTVPRMRHARATDEGGRGLFLVARLSHRHGTRFTTGGKIVWAEQELTPSI